MSSLSSSVITPAPMRMPSGLPAVPTKLPPTLLGKLGETFATSLSVLQRELSSLGSVTPSQHDALRRAAAEIDTLVNLGVRIQGIARMLSGGAPMPVERVALVNALNETLDTWTPASAVMAVDTAAVQPCDVEVNAAVLEQLLTLAIECALQTGPQIQIDVTGRGQPPIPVLTIHAHRPDGAAAGDGTEEIGDLRWALFALLARAVGLAPQRVVAGQVVTTELGFPQSEPSSARLKKDALVEGPPRTPSAAGRRVLLIEPRESARLMAHDLLRRAGMRIDSVASMEQARDAWRDGVPDVVVTGIPVDDDAMATLLDDIRRAQPRLRIVQLVDDENAFSFSSPESEQPAQVGRPNLALTLVAAVAQELDAARTT